MNEAEFLKKYNDYKVRKFKRTARWVHPGKILFFGDSITEFFPLRTALKGYQTFNSGISGNTTLDMLERMEICVYPYRPCAVVVLAGVNDIINEKKDAAYVIGNYRKILQGLHAHGIKKVVIQSCYPTYGDFAYANEEIKRVNLQLEQLAAEFDYLYLDLHTLLTDPHSGELVTAYSKDGLHPNKKGYQVITELLKKVLDNFLAANQPI